MSRAEKTEEDQKMINDWLAQKNNKITICPPDTRTPEEDVVYIYKVGKRGRKPAPIVTKSPHDKS